MSTMVETFDAFSTWLTGPGTKILRVKQDMSIRQTSVVGATSLVSEHWQGLHILDFLRSRVELYTPAGTVDPAGVFRQPEWEGEAMLKEKPTCKAEFSCTQDSAGEHTLRWKCHGSSDQGSSDLLELLFNSLTQGMMVTDPAGTVLKINPAIYRRMKQSETDRLGRSFWDSHEWHSVPSSMEKAKRDILRAAAGESVTETYQTMPFGNRTVHLKLQMHPIMDPSGSVKYIAIEGTPVTQEVENKKELDLQRSIIRSFFEFLPLPVWVIDVQGHLVMMNDAYAEVYGLTDADVGKNIYAKRSEKISEQCIRNNQTVFRTRIPLHSVEYIKDVKGDTRIYHVTKFPIEGAGGESLIGGVSLDMTDKIKAEQQLRQALERFEHVSEATNDLIYDWDIRTGVLKLVGNAFGIYEELKDRDVHISELLSFLHPEDLARQNKRLEKAIKNRQRMDWHAEFRIRDRDGGFLHVMDRAVIHRDGEGTAYRIVGSIQDITAIHELNRRLQESQKEDFRRSQRVAYEVAERERNRISEELHDNVNPLLAAARLHIGVSESDPEQSSENLLRSKTLIFDAIDVIRNLSQRISIVLLKDRALDEILPGFLRRFHGEGGPVVTVTGKKLEAVKDQYFKMNVLRIVQEQFGNTLRYAEASAFDVDLTVKQGQLHLRIQDDGKGFDTRQENEGLGFSDIAGRVEAYGGKMKIHSAPGQGCRLDITLPLPENP